MKRANLFFAVSIPVTLVAACGGSSSNPAPGGDGGGAGQDSGGAARDAAHGSDATAGNDAAAGADANGGGGDATADGNPGNGGNDCTTCVPPQAVCCATLTGGMLQAVTCVANQSSCPGGSSVYGCLGPADCNAGQVCCESGGGTSMSTSCVTTCPTSRLVCQAPSDCPVGAFDCPMDGVRGDVGYGVCAPLPDGGAGEGGGVTTDGGTSDGGGEGGAIDGGGVTTDGGDEGASPQDAAAGG
jgi:hypothetical protein